jgi:hypothetical protein
MVRLVRRHGEEMGGPTVGLVALGVADVRRCRWARVGWSGAVVGFSARVVAAWEISAGEVAVGSEGVTGSWGG